MPGEYGVHTTFNVADLSSFDVGDDLRSNPSQEGENDARPGADYRLKAGTTRDHLSLPEGPVTRLRAKRFKEALNGLIEEHRADYGKGETEISPSAYQGLIHVIGTIYP